MVDLKRIEALLDERRPGHALPRAFYTDPEVFEFDREAIHRRSWILAGFEVELPRVGSHLALSIAGAPVFVVRGQDGVLRGFHNTCRHRGSRILADGKGASARLVCPYHRWTYDLSGELVHAARMGEAFEACEHGLHPIQVETCAGAVYVCAAEDAPDFQAFRDKLAPLLAPHRLGEARLAHESVLVERGNWKLAMENARECYHCATSHPELSLTFPTGVSGNFDYGEEARRHADYNARMAGVGLEVGPHEGDWWQAIRFPLNEGCRSMTMDGRTAVRKLMVEAGDGDIGSLRWAVEPHGFVHATADFLFMFSAMPLTPRETLITSKWLVHRDAEEGVDYDLDHLTELWNRTNLQDLALVENNQQGVESPAFTPGPYCADAEALTMRFTDWYCAAARAYLERHNGR
ncbi:MAG TPA: aromatic ring-hydroxylating dioxygenase subunit alpha [Caulobacteraceae bacterium]|jgi:Rieske 2Fe-2S family protein|nr:aromatic ring-hydroxylating dioxygenase subunit alpha [Caulobacteraceae bacterium]